MEFTVLIVQYLKNNFSKVCSSYGQFAYFSDIFIFGKSENCIGKICQLIITWTNFSRQTNYSYLGSYYKYWSYHKYVLFEFFWLIFIYTYRTMAFLYFPLGEKLKKLKFSISFQIYVSYDLKNQVCNIYKYRTYNRNLVGNIVHVYWRKKISDWNISRFVRWKLNVGWIF